MDDSWLAAALHLHQSLTEAGIPFCIIGGLAVQHWGEPRVTEDVDAAVLAPLGEEKRVVDTLLTAFAPAERNSFERSLITRVLLLQDADRGVGIDISLAAAQFEFDAISRSQIVPYAPGVDLRICGPEDLVTYKAFANRPIDWRDVEGILIRQQGRLDFELIETNLQPLCELKEDPQIYARYLDLRDQHR